jgi:exosome complex component RRP42
MLVGGVNPPGRVILSTSEIQYISGGVSQNLRADGRGCRDFRVVTAELNPVPQAAGSARLRIGGTDILVSVKGDIGRPLVDKPTEGQVICSVDSSTVFSMNAAMASSNEERLVQDRNAELTAILDDILVKSGVIDMKMFSIISGKHCWVIYLDVLVLDYDGNLIDAIVMAARLALSAMRLPCVRIEEGGEATEIVLGEDVDTTKIVKASKLPVAVTIGKIGNGFVIDPSGPEEACCDVGLIFALLEDGKIVALRKLGTGMIDPGLLSEYMSAAHHAASQLRGLVDSVLISGPN